MKTRQVNPTTGRYVAVTATAMLLSLALATEFAGLSIWEFTRLSTQVTATSNPALFMSPGFWE
jgi:hypothetical protein